MSVPERSDRERVVALEAALAARQERARLRAGLKSRTISAVDIIEGSAQNRLWASLRVRWLLESLPGVGEARAQRLLAALEIAPSRRIQGLGTRQRASLLAALGKELG